MQGNLRNRIPHFVWAFLLSGALRIGSQESLRVGFAQIRWDPGSPAAAAAALLTYSNSDGVLISQAGVGATRVMRRGKIFVDETGPRTGIALVNTSQEPASIKLILYDLAGREQSRRAASLGAGEHFPRYVADLFPNLPPGFTGSITFESDQTLGAITLRESLNGQGELLYATLPVLDLESPGSAQPVVFPHVAAGGGYSTQIILVNGGSQSLKGRLNLVADDGNPLSLQLAGNPLTEAAYTIAPQGVYFATLERASGLASGYAVVTPDPDSSAPSGVAIFQVKRGGFLMTEAGVGISPPASRARIYVDNAGSYTGLAVANRENQPVTITLSLMDTGGVLVDVVTQVIPARGNMASFVHDLFPRMPGGFTGLLDISSATAVSSVTLKLTINERSDHVYTTLPIADLTAVPFGESLVFPHIPIGAGFSTRLVFINPSTTSPASGLLSFHRSGGGPLTVPIGGRADSVFRQSLPQGGGRQIQPGNTARLASITLVDPALQLATAELAVNEGNTARPSLRILDTEGKPRDDFDLTYRSLNTDVASVDSLGNVTGRTAGFSTLAMSSGGVVATATITVVSAKIGIAGFKITGVAQDLASRLYLAATQDHAILLADNRAYPPQVYAGERGHSGLKNDFRLQSLFNSPAFLAYDQLQGALYVSDGANNVVRNVQPGPLGKVKTVAGTASAGSKDGSGTESEFNNPQGIAIDGRGNLWVADSGNHTIRRINLTTGVTETVAGRAGTAGYADGIGREARFDHPAGIAIERDAPPSFLQSAQPPMPVSLVVADSGNGLIRRVTETGLVETIGSTTAKQAPARRGQDISLSLTALSTRFNGPAGVAVDPVGNIYVAEPGAARVRVILRNGDVVQAAQSNTFASPVGITVPEQGRLVVADQGSREIRYGEPAVFGISPAKIGSKGGERVTVTGKNFAPDSLVIAGGELIPAAEIRDTQTISFVAPPLLSGQTTLTVQNRGGLTQAALIVDATPLAALNGGHITTVAGGTTYVGDGKEASTAGLDLPIALALDALGNLYIADSLNHRIRRVAARSGIITTIAGTGLPGYSGDGRPAAAAHLNSPSALAVDAQGNIFIADNGNYRIRRIDAGTGKISTVAGGGDPPFPPGDDLLATDTSFGDIGGLALDPDGSLYIADAAYHRIRKMDARTSRITTVAGDGRAGYSGDGGPATAASLNEPRGISLDSTGSLFIADSRNLRVRKLDLGSGLITTIAGNGEKNPASDGKRATETPLVPSSVALDSFGNLFIADIEHNLILKVRYDSQTIAAVAGGGDPPDRLGDDLPAVKAKLDSVQGVAVDASGNLLIADAGHDRVRLVAALTGIISTIAGSDRQHYAGDDGPATAAMLNEPLAAAVDARGNLFISDSDNNRVRRVDSATGRITTLAGTGETTYSGDGKQATAAALVRPAGIALDAIGNVYIAASGNHNIRKVDASTGIITTVAGTGDEGYSGDNGPATAARLSAPQGIAFDARGRLFIADTLNNRIRMVDAVGIITTVAVGPLIEPSAVAFDGAGNLYIADSGNHRIRKLDAGTEQTTTVAGNGTEGFRDNLPATTAALSWPRGIAIDGGGNLFIADGNNRIRRVAAATGTIVTVAGSGETAMFGDNGPATTAGLGFPFGVALDREGNVYIADTFNHRIRAIRAHGD